MSGDDDQRFPVTQGLFGWKGFGKDKSHQTTIFIVSLIVNFFLLLHTVSTLGSKNATGEFSFSAGQMSAEYYLFGGITILACVVSAILIQYEEFAVRWAARFLASGLPALFVVILPFLWGQ